MAIRQPQNTEQPNRLIALDRVHQNDTLVAADGVELGTLQGLYEQGPFKGHLLVQGAGDAAGRREVYTVPVWTLDRLDERTRSVYVSASSAHARSHWLIDVG